MSVGVNSRKKHRLVYVCLIIVLSLFVAWIAWGNTALELNIFTVSSDDLPEAFNGFRIAQVSDLHNAEMGKDNKKLIAILEESNPDIIVLTGDILDSKHTDEEIALRFLDKATDIAPCYFITGNHEGRITKSIYETFEKDMLELGVIVLHDNEVIIENEEETVSLVGIDDPVFAESNGGGIGISMTSRSISALASGEGFSILLAHRPEFFKQYVYADFDLVLCGHAHGGQFRLPFVGGIIAPNQGFFPEYDSGLYTEGDTNMIVSRGIGNSIIPFRVNNRPEIVVVELVCG